MLFSAVLAAVVSSAGGVPFSETAFSTVGSGVLLSLLWDVLVSPAGGVAVLETVPVAVHPERSESTSRISKRVMGHQFDVCNWERFPSCAQLMDGITIFIDIGLWLHVFHGAYRS